MSDRSTTAGRVIEVVKEVLCIEDHEPPLDSTFVEDLGASSLDQVSLFMALEDEFDERIPDGDLERFATLRDVVDYIEARAVA